MSVPRWNDPDADLSIKPKRKRGKPKLPQRKCMCGCGAGAGWNQDNKPNRYIHGHWASKAGVAKVKVDNEMALERALERETQEREAFEADLDRLFAEASNLGLAGDALIAHVYSDEMEQRAVRQQIRRAVLDSAKESANWLHARKHGGVKAKPAGTSTKAPVSFLDPLDSQDEVYES